MRELVPPKVLDSISRAMFALSRPIPSARPKA